MIKNVLIVTLDQLRYDATGINGNKLVSTPNLDAFARKSMRFNNCFTASPVCAAARHSIATGLYPYAHGVVNNDYFPYKGMRTLGHEALGKGMRRFNSGHMHWKGLEDDNGFEKTASPGFYKTAVTDKVWDIYQWEYQSKTRRRTAGPSARNKKEFWGYHTALCSVEQMEQAVKDEQNFINITSIYEPHPPFYPPKEFYENINPYELEPPIPPSYDADKEVLKIMEEWEHFTEFQHRAMKAGYYGFVNLADYYFGMVMDAADRLNLWEDTMIIFTSDHGEQLGDHGMYMKFNMREPSVRVPMFIYHPDCRPGINNNLTQHTDIYPTVCEELGINIPENLNGSSLMPYLQETHADEIRDFAYAQIGNTHMIRTHDFKLNLYDNGSFSKEGLYHDGFADWNEGIIMKDVHAGELYDLASDPEERVNVISEYPDKVRELTKMYGDLTADI